MVNKVSDNSDEDDEGTFTINYWNMKNFMPFFGGDNHDFDKMLRKIGDEAATKIQTWWKDKGKDKNYTKTVL